MANFAIVNSDNIVENIVVVDDKLFLDAEYPETEKIGAEYLESLGFEGKFFQNEEGIRNTVVSVGYIYNEEHDAFIAPKPYPSWTLSENFKWVPPFMPPDDGNTHIWNEEDQVWEVSNG